MVYAWHAISEVLLIYQEGIGDGMEYTVVTEPNREDLIRKVIELIKQGWKPHGGNTEVVVAPM